MTIHKTTIHHCSKLLRKVLPSPIVGRDELEIVIAKNGAFSQDYIAET